ncbi:hypothetical protein ACMHYQ_12100 [Ectopseudomonas guguanensis]
MSIGIEQPWPQHDQEEAPEGLAHDACNQLTLGTQGSYITIKRVI